MHGLSPKQPSKQVESGMRQQIEATHSPDSKSQSSYHSAAVMHLGHIR